MCAAVESGDGALILVAMLDGSRAEQALKRATRNELMGLFEALSIRPKLDADIERRGIPAATAVQAVFHSMHCEAEDCPANKVCDAIIATLRRAIQ